MTLLQGRQWRDGEGLKPIISCEPKGNEWVKALLLNPMAQTPVGVSLTAVPPPPGGDINPLSAESSSQANRHPQKQEGFPSEACLAFTLLSWVPPPSLLASQEGKNGGDG